MASQVSRIAKVLARRSWALLGAFGLLGAVAPAQALPNPERAALEARVAEVRRHLGNAGQFTAPTLIVQSAKWNNWPNWSNWANWRNG
jgi:hypothetical protein